MQQSLRSTLQTLAMRVAARDFTRKACKPGCKDAQLRAPKQERALMDKMTLLGTLLKCSGKPILGYNIEFLSWIQV